MTKNELRILRRGNKTSAGNITVELEEIRKMQTKNGSKELVSITVTCGEVLTLICC